MVRRRVAMKRETHRWLAITHLTHRVSTLRYFIRNINVIRWLRSSILVTRSRRRLRNSSVHVVCVGTTCAAGEGTDEISVTLRSTRELGRNLCGNEKLSS